MKCGMAGVATQRAVFGLARILQRARFRGVGSVSDAARRIEDIHLAGDLALSFNRSWTKIRNRGA